jgi:hypothetical protein
MLHDLRFTFRTLSRTPVFAMVAILSLALGIGANTAMFSLLDQVMFRLLPIRDQERVVVFHFEGRMGGASQSDSDASVFSYPLYRDFRDRSQVFEGVIARSSAAVNILTNDQAEQAQVEIVSGNFFDVLGVRPVVGRLLSADDDITPGGHPVIVLSHGYWTRKFASSTAILNQTIRVNGLSMTVVGIAPRNFRSVVSSHTPDIYAPIAMKAQLTPGVLDNRRQAPCLVERVCEAEAWRHMATGDRCHGRCSARFSKAAEEVVGRVALWSAFLRASWRSAGVQESTSLETLGDAAGGGDGDGWIGAADRLRERRQSADRARSSRWGRSPSGGRSARAAGRLCGSF